MRAKTVMFALLFLFFIGLSSAAIKTITVNETDLVSLKLEARDEDGDSIYYNFTEPLDSEGRWQTGYGDAGEYTIIVTASDGILSTSKEVLLDVRKKNAAPTVESYSPSGEELEIDEGKSISFSITASDLNNDVLQYRWKIDDDDICTGPSCTYSSDYMDAGLHDITAIASDGEKEDVKVWGLRINKVDRTLLLDGMADIEVDEGDKVRLEIPDLKEYNLEYSISEPLGDDNFWQTGYDDAGSYETEIMAYDRGFSFSKKITITINDIDREPVFKDISAAWMEENQQVTIELEAYDPDGDEVEFYAEQLPDGATLEGNTFTWLPDNSAVEKKSCLEKALDKFHILYKPFKITFTAKSKGIEAKQDVLIMVKDKNRAPVLSDIAPITIKEGEEAVIEPEAYDPDGDRVIYTYTGWSNSRRRLTGYDDAGVYRVKVTASDSFLKDEKYAEITVEDANRAPEFEDIGPLETDENEKLELKIGASDPDGDHITISCESMPENSTIEDGVFAWVPGHDATGKGSTIYSLRFIASDGEEESFKTVNITVHDANRAPKITSASYGKSIKVSKGKKVKFIIEAEVPDGDELKYVWRFGFLDSYKAGNAMVRKFTAEGDKEVRVTVSDGKDEAEYRWDVKVV
ncbi:hypothetical protein KY358_03100 [Candidatus Woesearchaeota archaeon]|nr:hypothetical protein [Candidatus Woesearchaeota archaeon]